MIVRDVLPPGNHLPHPAARGSKLSYLFSEDTFLGGTAHALTLA